MHSPVKVVVGLVLALSLLAACSGDGEEGDGGGGTAQGVSADAYARSLCTSIQSYVDEVTTLSTDFASGIDPAASLEDQKQGVLAFLDDVLESTGRLIDGVTDAGVPDVEGGAAVVAAIEDSFQQARSVLEDARAQVEAIPVDDPQTFADQLNEIGSTIQSSLGEIGGSLSALESAELTEAVRNEPACEAVASTAGA